MRRTFTHPDPRPRPANSRRLMLWIMAVALVGADAGHAFGQAPSSPQPAQPAQQATAPPPATQQPPGAGRGPARLPEGFPDLIGGLRGTPGCLGVDAARTMSGKQVIFAWFRDKAAVLKWYYSDMHKQAQSRFFPDRPRHKPLERIPDDSGPILAIASITWADSATLKRTSLPISQIAIELYQPIPGGLFAGGRFAPDSLKVEGMSNVTLGVQGAEQGK